LERKDVLGRKDGNEIRERGGERLLRERAVAHPHAVEKAFVEF